MKIKHHITGSLLLLAFAVTHLASAATIPQLKSPPKVPVVKAPKEVRLPSVKIPAAVQTVKAPKVPVVKTPKEVKLPAVKIPATVQIVKTPKVPVIKVPQVTKVPEVKTPRIVKVPTAPKEPRQIRLPQAPKEPKAPRLVKVPTTSKETQPPKAVKVPVTDRGAKTEVATRGLEKVKVREIAINAGKLRNLKERIQVNAPEISSKEGRFIQDNFGSAANVKAGSLMDGIKGNAGQRSKNPIPGKADQMVGGKRGQLSDDPAEEGSYVDDVVNFVSSVVGSFLSGAGTSSPAGAAAGGTAGALTGAAGTILTANGTPEDKKNEAQGIIGLFRQAIKGTTNENAADLLDQVEKTPLPDDMSPSSNPVITKDTIRGIEARKGGATEPVEEDSGSTGPVNTGANGTGKLGSLAQPAGDSVSGATAVTDEDFRGLRVRIESKINPVNR